MHRAVSKFARLLVFSGAALLALCPVRSGAQQVTYYNFDTPATASPQQYSYTCSPSNPGTNPLFCLNDATGTSSNPSFIQDPAGSGTWAAQLTPGAGSQAGSLWFSVPQNVAGGFNAWFEFRMTPVAGSTFTADGIAFVIQNAQGGAGTDASSGCSATGSGPTAVGGGGGCIGYSGIDNSVALEFDSYFNSPYDPEDQTHGYYYDDNHVSLQSCGPGKPNSSAHLASDSGPGCEVYLPGPNGSQIPTLVSNPGSSSAPPAASTPVVLTDGNVHQVVVVYNGPNDTPANYIYVYLDPAFDPGTVTPVAGSVPLFSGPYDITQALNLINTGSGNNSAYVGFTSATGFSFEQHELLGWTFTPHTPVTQQQPLQPGGSPTYTQFPFGTHTYGVQYPADGPSTSGVSMTVTANTVTPTLFSQLIAGTPFQGSACQVYDDTGGNCIIYSVSCSVTGSNPAQIVACPAVTSVPDCTGSNAASCINVKTVFNTSTPPVSPGYLQGDPFFSQVSALNVSGDTATFTCTGECSVSQGQTVSVIGAQPASFNGSYTVTSVSALNQFTAQTAGGASGSATTPGYLTSNNLKNIFVSYTTANIDGTSTGRTTNFSDFVFTSQTNDATTQMQLSAATNTPTLGQPDLLTATITGSATQISAPTGNVVFYARNTLLCSSPVSTVASVTTATCSYTPAAPGPVTLTAQYLGDIAHLVSNAGPLNLNVAAPQMLTINPSSIDFGTQYLGSLVTKLVNIANTGTGPVTIHDPFIALLTGGNSSEFVTLNLCPKSLAAGKSCTMIVAFIAGPYYTPQTATLIINDNAYGGPHTVPLTATVIDPQARLSRSLLSFGKVKVGTASSPSSVTLTSSGATALSIDNVTLGGANAGDFLLSNSCAGSLNPKATCSIGVTFKPTTKGLRTAVVIVNDNAFSSPERILLTGTGN
jgi:hypothetical protein